MEENENRAREFVEQDARTVGKRMRELFGTANISAVAFDDSDRSQWPTGDGTGMPLPVTIGVRDNLTKAAARERAAALPSDRTEALRRFHEAGIFTWVSLEPTIDVEASLAIVAATQPFLPPGYPNPLRVEQRRTIANERSVRRSKRARP